MSVYTDAKYKYKFIFEYGKSSVADDITSLDYNKFEDTERGGFGYKSQ